jgi:hypothetical protein
VSSLGGDGLRSSTHLGLHAGADSSARCYTYPDKPPILSVTIGRTNVAISPAGSAVTSDHVEFTYTLLAAVNDYLIECERVLFAGQDAAEPPGDLAA